MQLGLPNKPTNKIKTNFLSGSMFEVYCALAEYVAEDASQVSFKPGDKVLVMSKDQSGEGWVATKLNSVMCNRRGKLVRRLVC